jgi:hypothetical protein
LEAVTYENQWERQEFLRAMRQGQRVSKWDFFLIILLVAMGLVLWQQTGSPIFLPAFGVAGVVGDLVLHFIVQPARIWKLSVGAGDPKQIVFSDRGLSVISKSATAEIPWSAFARTREKKDYYFLDQKNAPITTAFRKSSFKSDQDRAQFRAIVGRNTTSKLTPNRGLAGSS